MEKATKILADILEMASAFEVSQRWNLDHELCKEYLDELDAKLEAGRSLLAIIKATQNV